MTRPKLIRITTLPISLKYLIKGQMRFMSKNGFDITMISSDGKELKEVIDAEKCNHFIIPLTRKITPLKDLNAVYKLFILLRQLLSLIHI